MRREFLFGSSAKLKMAPARRKINRSFSLHPRITLCSYKVTESPPDHGQQVRRAVPSSVYRAQIKRTSSSRVPPDSAAKLVSLAGDPINPTRPLFPNRIFLNTQLTNNHLQLNVN